MRDAKLFYILVASSDDVQFERGVLPGVIAELNHGVGRDRGIHLVLTSWETEALPGFYVDGPQGLTTSYLNVINDSDLLIGIFWKHLGIRAEAGRPSTEQLFRIAHDLREKKEGPQIFIYFNDAPISTQDVTANEQKTELLKFRNAFPPEGLWWSYESKDQFEKLVRDHLTRYILEQFKPNNMATQSQSKSQMNAEDTPAINEEELDTRVMKAFAEFAKIWFKK